MRFLNLAIAAPAMLAAFASAAVIRVEVGRNGGLRFTPNDIKAAQGDIVEFHFDAMHSVIAGDFNKACNPVSSGGFYSDEMPRGDQTFFSIAINNTDPIFFYCGVDGHCQGGMVGAINQNTDQTLAAYRTAAENSDGTVHPTNDHPFGGTLSSDPITSVASSGTPSTASKSASSQPMTSAASGTASSTPSEASTTASETSTTASETSTTASETSTTASEISSTSASGSPSAAPTITSNSDSRFHNMPMEGIACLILAGAAAMFIF